MSKTNDQSGEITIIKYEAQYATYFASINYEWLKEYFTIEPQDQQQLENPYEKIIKPGGQVLFALLGDQVVGTIGLSVKGESTFELIKMGVMPGYKGMGIGNLLVKEAIKYGRKHGKKKIVLETNDKLVPALKIYKKAGFKEIDPDPDSKYTRCNVWMELRI